jgi:hypothetical protein
LVKGLNKDDEDEERLGSGRVTGVVAGGKGAVNLGSAAILLLCVVDVKVAVQKGENSEIQYCNFYHLKTFFFIGYYYKLIERGI